jgi:L-alanine-DL-glutamate epimerase-like enolase superfamily enzyme
MKITDVKVFELVGRRIPQLALFEPVSGIGGHPGWSGSTPGTIKRRYVQIETNEGLNGLSATLTDTAALYIIKHILKDSLIDEDPLAVEALWEKMYQNLVHNRKGSGMIAISLLNIEKNQFIAFSEVPLARRYVHMPQCLGLIHNQPQS